MQNEILEGHVEAMIACYDVDESVEEALRELTTQVVNGCDGIPAYMI